MADEPKEKKKKRFNYQTTRANSTHVVILVVIGAYLAYMGWRMIQNTLSGASTMSMTTTIVLTVVMWLVALGIFGYAGFVFYMTRKKAEMTEEEARELDEEMARADRENYEEEHPYEAALEALYDEEDRALDEDGDVSEYEDDDEYEYDDDDEYEYDDDDDEDDNEDAADDEDSDASPEEETENH